MIVPHPGDAGDLDSFLLERGGYQATWRAGSDVSIADFGPNALALCEELVAESLRDVKFMHLRFVNVAGKRAMAVRGRAWAGRSASSFMDRWKTRRRCCLPSCGR